MAATLITGSNALGTPFTPTASVFSVSVAVGARSPARLLCKEPGEATFKVIGDIDAGTKRNCDNVPVGCVYQWESRDLDALPAAYE